MSRRVSWTSLQRVAGYFSTIVEKIFYTIVGTLATVVVRMLSEFDVTSVLWYKK
jgi:hypothetical protein